jgi:DNA invertase Pin-like site-specific DNA recombinase
VNHIDGNKENNSADNLEWATASENLTHAYKVGLAIAVKGTKNGHAKLTPQIIQKMKEMVALGHTQKRVGRLLGINQSQVSRILANKAWSHLNEE